MNDFLYRCVAILVWITTFSVLGVLLALGM